MFWESYVWNSHFGEKTPTKTQFYWNKSINFGHICFDEILPQWRFDMIPSKSLFWVSGFSIPLGIFLQGQLFEFDVSVISPFKFILFCFPDGFFPLNDAVNYEWKIIQISWLNNLGKNRFWGLNSSVSPTISDISNSKLFILKFFHNFWVKISNVRHFKFVLFLLEAEHSKIYLKITLLVFDCCIYSPVEMWYSFVSTITVALPTCRILFNSTRTVPVLFVLLMRNSTAFVSSVQFQQNVFWQEAVTGHCTICNQKGGCNLSREFLFSKAPVFLITCHWKCLFC